MRPSPDREPLGRTPKRQTLMRGSQNASELNPYRASRSLKTAQNTRSTMHGKATRLAHGIHVRLSISATNHRTSCDRFGLTTIPARLARDATILRHGQLPTLVIDLDDRNMSPSTDERRPIKRTGKESACKTNHNNLFPPVALIHALIPHSLKCCALRSAPAANSHSSWKRMTASPPRSPSAQVSRVSGRRVCRLPAPSDTAMPTKRPGANS